MGLPQLMLNAFFEMLWLLAQELGYLLCAQDVWEQALLFSYFGPPNAFIIKIT